jgi:hypothetical protein
MRQQFKTGAVFALLVVAGALTASAVAGLGPLRASQTTTTVSVSTTTTTATDTTTTTATDTTTTTPRRLTICHHVFAKKGTKHRTLRINRSGWNGHLRHGDSVGACNTASAKKFHSRKAHIKRWHKKPR